MFIKENFIHSLTQDEPVVKVAILKTEIINYIEWLGGVRIQLRNDRVQDIQMPYEEVKSNLIETIA